MLKTAIPFFKRFSDKLVKALQRPFFINCLNRTVLGAYKYFFTIHLKIDHCHVVSFAGDKATLFKTTQPYVLGDIGLWFCLVLNMRFLDWVKLKLFPNLREDVMTQMFSYLNQHSHHYFQNNFAGSLINKITDMQQGVINIFSTLDDSYSQILGITVAVIMLLLIHPIFAFILMGWAVAFLAITILFLKPIQMLSHDFAESKTSVVGKMVDSISNIMNVRLFARFSDENRYIHQSIENAVQKDRAMQTKIIHMRIFWDVSIIALMSLNLFILFYLYSKNLVTIGDFTFVISLSISILWNLWFIVRHTIDCRQPRNQSKA